MILLVFLFDILIILYLCKEWLVIVGYRSIHELVDYASEAEGKYLTEIDKKDLLSNSNKKAFVGYIIEESYFDISPNSAALPDFPELGVELKTTGIVKRKNGKLAAKERLVLNIINFMNEINNTFYTSSFWQKNNKLLIFFYSYVRDENSKPDYQSFQIIKTVLHEFDNFDLEIIKQDWATIQSKINQGEAHMLSEGDTNILGACPKGANKTSMRQQPYSEVPAMQRAYSLKSGYMTTLVRKYINNEKLISFTTSQEVKEKVFEEILKDYFDPFIGKSITEIANILNVDISSSKNRNQLLTSAILGITGTSINQIEEFSKLNIKFKTIVMENTGSIKESMSFEKLDFDEIYYDPFDDSELKEKFESTQWLFVVFQKGNDKIPRLKKVLLWHVPEEILNNEIRGLYDEVKRLMHEEGINEIMKGNRFINNLPKSKFNGVCHIRPKGKNRKESMINLPNGQKIPSQSFWFNASYIKSIISNET